MCRNSTASRSSRFFQLEAAAYIGNILSYVSSSALVDVDPWIPIVLGLLLLSLVGVHLLVTARSIKVERRETREELTTPPGEIGQDQCLVDGSADADSDKTRWKYVYSFFMLVKQRKVILALLVGYWLRMLAVSVTGLQLLYVSRIFNWSYSKV